MTAKIIGVLGGAGSPGMTTVASNLAKRLVASGNKTVYLLDWDEDGAVLPLRWGAEDTGALSTLYQMAQIGDLSDEVMDQASQQVMEQLWVVSGFRGLERSTNFNIETAWRVLTNFAGRADVLILDCGRLRVNLGVILLQRLDKLIWVVNPSPEGAVNWRKTWSLADGSGLPFGRMGAVINQSNHPQALLDFPQQWRERYNLPIVAKIPYFPNTPPEIFIKPGLTRSKLERALAHSYENLVNEVWQGNLDSLSNVHDEEEPKKKKLFGLLGGK